MDHRNAPQVKNPPQRVFSEASSNVSSNPGVEYFLWPPRVWVSLGGGTNASMVVCNVFRGGVKTTTAPLRD